MIDKMEDTVNHAFSIQSCRSCYATLHVAISHTELSVLAGLYRVVGPCRSLQRPARTDNSVWEIATWSVAQQERQLWTCSQHFIRNSSRLSPSEKNTWEKVRGVPDGQQVRRCFDHVIENGNDGHVILGLFFKR